MNDAAVIARDTSTWTQVLPENDLQASQSTLVKVAGSEVLLCRVGTEYLAVENRCTHQAASLEGGRIRNGMIACPVHGVMFDLRTGCGKGPLGKVPLKTFATQIIEGYVWVANQPNP